MAAKTATCKDRAMPSASNVYTLPLSCQICLGKVRQPVLCSNFHVFCRTCIDIWLERSHRCPSCRVLIDHTNPVKQIRGGLSQTEDDDREKSTPELRKTRFDLLYRDYEDILEKQEREVKLLRGENACLKSQLAVSQGGAGGSKGPGGGGGGSTEQHQLLLLTSKLQDAQKLYDRVKQDISKLKKDNHSLKDANANLTLENTRLREEISSRSPQKFGRLTVATLETQLDQQKKEVQRLTRALERSDHYIESLQQHTDTDHHPTDPPSRHPPGRPSPHDAATGFINGSSSSNGLPLHAHSRSAVPVSGSSVKRQLFSSSSQSHNDLDFSSADGIGKPRALGSTDSVGQSRSTVGGVDSRFSGRFSPSPSGPKLVNAEPDDLLESIMRKSDPVTSKPDPANSKKDKSPKKVHFNLTEEKKSNDSSSFNLEAPSPIAHSSSTSDYGLSSDKLPTRLQGSSEFSHKPAAHRNIRGAPPDWVERIEDDGDSITSPRKDTNDLSARRAPSYTLKDEALSRLLTQRYGHQVGKKGHRHHDNSSNLSEPERSMPQSLEELDSGKSLSSGKTVTFSKEGVAGQAGGRVGRQGPNLSFGLEEPSLDDTQTIRTELKDLDISVTPELSDCLKLLKRAERKVSHAQDAPGFMTQAGTASAAGNSAACVTTYSVTAANQPGSQPARLYSASDLGTAHRALGAADPGSAATGQYGLWDLDAAQKQYGASGQGPPHRHLTQSNGDDFGKGGMRLGAETRADYPVPNTSGTSGYCGTSGYSGTSGYPSSTSGYPSSTSSYSTSTSNYPGSTSNYPTSTSNYSTSTSNYPTSTSNYSTSTSNYPGSTSGSSGNPLGGTLSSWEHGFFSSLRVNPYKHSALHSTHAAPAPSHKHSAGFDMMAALPDEFKPLSGPSRKSDPSSWTSSMPLTGMGSKSSSLTDVRREFSQASAIPSSSRLGGRGAYSSITRSMSSEQLSTLPSGALGLGWSQASASSGRFPEGRTTAADRARCAEPASSVYPMNIAPPPSSSLGQHGFYGGQGYSTNPSSSVSDQHRSGAVPMTSTGAGDAGFREKRTNNYSYISNASSSQADHTDSFLPEPKKRLFDNESEEESDFGTPSKATRVL